ncbi:hypothetical protein Tco_0948573 [Tanacetum coccineum]
MGYFARECRVPISKEGQFKNQDKTRKQGNNKDTSSKAMLAIDDKTCSKTCLKNYETLKKQCDDLIVKLNQTEFTAATYKRGLATVEEQLITYRKNEVLFSEEVAVLKREMIKENSDNSLVKEQVSKDTSRFVESSLNVDKETIFPVDKKVKSVKPKNHEKPVKKSVRYAEMYRSQTPRGNQRNWNGQKSNQLGSDFVMYNKACFICGSFNHVQAQCKYHQRERMVYGNNYNRVNYNYTTKRTHPNAQRNMVPRAVLMKTGLKPFNTARTVNTAHPKSTVFSAKPMSCFPKTAQSTVRRPFQTKTTLSNKRFTQAVNTARPQAVNTARPKTVKTARPNSAVVNAVRVNQANDGKPQRDDIGFVNSGCSRHMTGNIAYLLDFKEFDGGYVTFGGGAHGGRISDASYFDSPSKDVDIGEPKSATDDQKQFEKVKQENEGIEFKIEKFDKASKDLDKLLESQITDKSKKGLGYSAGPSPHPLIYNRPKTLDLSYSGLDEFKLPKFKGYGSEDSKKESNVVCDKKSYDSKENSDNSLVASVKPKNHENPVKKSVRYAEMYRSQTPRGNQRDWNGQKSNQLGSDFVMVNYNYTTKRTHSNAQRNMVPKAVLIKTSLKPFNTARTVNTAQPKSTIFSAKPMSRFSNIAQSTVRRPFQSKTELTNKRFTQKVNTAKAQAVNTARPQAVNIARLKEVKCCKGLSMLGLETYQT